MIQLLRKISFAFLLIACHSVFSEPKTGLLFNVTATGTPAHVSMILCLNGKGPTSCQNYDVSALTVSIRTTPAGRTYPLAGIKITTPGYTLGNLGVDCTLLPNGYCLFTASDHASKTFYVINAKGSLSVSSSSRSPILPNATAGESYSTAITVSGGVPPYTYTISSGQLPPGLTLNPTTGVVSGIPTGGGTYNFTITVTDSNQPTPDRGSETFSLTVLSLTLSPPTLPSGLLNTAYNANITASGGVGPYTFAVTSGSLPPGLILNPNGTLSGTPTSIGTYLFTVTGTDTEGEIGTKTYSVVINGSLALSPLTLPGGQLSTAYSQTITASGGVGPYTFAVTSGTLPPGLTLSSNGTLSGTPTSDGTYPFTITASDTMSSDTGSRAYSIVVSGSLTLNPPTLPAGQLSTAYSQTITASGGVGPYTFAVTSGTLPPGLTLNSNGTLSGTPTSDGTYPFTITASDTMSSDTGSKGYSIVVSGSLTLSPPTLLAGQLSTAYSQTITASGGVGPYTFAVTFGSLPPGLTLSSNGILSGTPTSDGTYPFTITATDTMSSDTGSKAYSIVVSGSLTLSPPTLPGGQLSTVYNQTITASGGVGPYTFAVTSGTLPPGLSLSSNGALTGTPTSDGTYPFTITASDTNSSDTGSKSYSIVVSGSLTLSPPTLPAGQLSTAYSQVITASGGVGPYTFAVTSGTLPPGLTLNSNGTLSGTPTSDGTYPFTITASDTMSSDTGSKAYSIVVSGSLTLSPPTLPAGQLSTVYNQTITASGGVGPYTFAVTSGTLPPGLTLSSNGTLSGTPTSDGTYPFTITASDTMSSDTGSRAYSIVVSGSLTLSPPTLPAGQLSTVYNQTITASGGVGPYTFAVTSGTLPPGLSLSSNGALTGTPTSDGTYPFTITATDTNSSDTGSKSYSIVVSGSLTLSPPTLPGGQLSTVYNQTITASGGVGPYTFAVTSGTLPPGLSLSSNGILSGTPTSDGTYPFTITATDTMSSDTGSKAYSIVVSGSLTLSPPTLPGGQLSTAYNQTITASGGVGPYTFAVTSGTLPPGLSLSSNGALTGTPTSDGTYPFTITASDTNSSDTGSKSYSIVVSGSLTLSPPTLPAGQLSTAYSQVITASGGVGPYTFAVTSGTLPPGLTLNSNGTLSGTPTSDGTYPFTITASDTNSSDTGSKGYSIVISGSLILSPTTLPTGQIGTAYSQTITASGGVGPYTFAVTSGTLPPGLTLNSNGTLSGTPTGIGTYSFTVTATDTNSSDTGSQAYTIVVTPVVYVTNRAGNTVSVCSVNVNGSLGTCTASNPGNDLNTPQGIALNPANSFAYIANVFANYVSICPINANKSISTCSSFTDATFAEPDSIVINAANTWAYMTNYNNSVGTTVSVCPVNPNGSLGACTAYNPNSTFSAPNGIALNPANTLAYIANFGNSTISVCTVNANGSLGTCSASAIAHLSYNIVLNAANTFAYITHSNDNLVSVCPINVGGSLGTCTASNPGATFNAPYGIALNVANTLAYISNGSGNTVSVCPINANGSLGTCTASSSGTFNLPLGITILSM